MSSCGSNNITKMFVVQPGDGPNLTVFENGGIILSGVTSLNFLNSTVVQSGSEGVDILFTGTTVDTFITGFTYNDANRLTITRSDGITFSVDISVMSGLTINGDLVVTGDTTLNSISGSSISINGGEVMTRIPSNLDFQLFGNQSSTGVIDFGGLSANTIDNSKFDLGPTKGWIVDNTTNPETPSVRYIGYSGSLGSNPSGVTLTYLATNPVTYIGMTGSTTGDIVQSITPFNNSLHRDTLVLGVVVHSDNATVNVTNNIPALGIDPTMQLYDLITGLGQFNLNDGGNTSNVYSANGSNLNIDKTSGDIFSHSSNYEIDPKNPHVRSEPSGSSITFRYRLSDSTEGGDTTEINPNIYETGGITASTPSNKYTIQRVTLFPSGISRLQYGQNVYDSLDDAEASISSETFIIENNINENGLLRGFIITRKGTTDLSDVNFARFVAANHFGHANDTVVGNVHRTEILNNSSTGLRNGGVMSVSTPSTFTVNSGSGVIIDNATNPNVPIRNEVTWDTITGVTLTNLATSVGTFIMMDSGGVINQFSLQAPPTQTDKRDKILLGAITHSDNINITNLFNAPIHIISPVNQHEDLTSSIGSFSVSGNFVKPIAGTVELVKTDGFSYFYGSNFQTDKTNPSVLTTALTSGSTTPFNPLVYATGTKILGLSGYSIDTDNYDPNGLGVITAANNNKYVAHRIWHIPINNLLVFQYGQQQYNSLNLAIDGFSTEEFVEPSGLSLGSYLISVIITKKGETDLSDITTTKFIQQDKFAGGGGGGSSIADTLQTAYNNSINPEIITTVTGGAVDIKNGTPLETNNLLTFENSSGGTTAWVNGLGGSSFTSVISNVVSGGTFYGDGSNLTNIPHTTDNFTSGTTLNGNTLIFNRTDALSAYTVDLSGLVTIDNFTTGATLSNNILTFNRTDALSAYTVDLSTLVVSDVFVTGFTYNDANRLTINRSDGATFNVNIGIMTGLTVNGNLFANTVSATTYYGDGSNLSGVVGVDNFTSGATLNGNTLIFSRTDALSAYTVDLSTLVVSSSGSTDNFTSGATLNGNTLIFNRTDSLSAYTVDLSTLVVNSSGSTDNFTTGATLNGNILSFSRTDALSAYTVDLSTLVVSSSGSTSVIFSNTPPSSSLSGNTWVRTTDYEYFIYDGNRGKWLSTNTNQFEGSRAKNNQTDVFLRSTDGSPYNLNPYYLPKDITISGVVGETSTSDTFKILISTGTTLPSDVIYELPISSNIVNSVINVDVDASAGESLYLYMSGTTIDYPKTTVYYKYR